MKRIIFLIGFILFIAVASVMAITNEPCDSFSITGQFMQNNLIISATMPDTEAIPLGFQIETSIDMVEGETSSYRSNPLKLMCDVERKHELGKTVIPITRLKNGWS